MTTSEIADLLSAQLVGKEDVEIDGVAGIETAKPNEAAFLEKDRGESTRAGCLIVSADFERKVDTPVIVTANPKAAFARIAAALHKTAGGPNGIHRTAIIAATADVGKEVSIDAFVVIGDETTIADGTELRSGVKIGARVEIGTSCVFHANVVVEDGCRIGNNVILHSGVVIGADGFGYVRDGETHLKFPQIGTVVIGDNVEIGANTCIDRGSLGVTRIGDGTKIDNLVQIAHNVEIGKRVIIAAQTGISGSTVIEDDCVIGGQVGMGDHARVQRGAVIGSQAGVLPGKIVRPGVWWGTPVQPLDEYKRQNAHVKGLGRLKDDVKELKKLVKGGGS